MVVIHSFFQVSDIVVRQELLQTSHKVSHNGSQTYSKMMNVMFIAAVVLMILVPCTFAGISDACLHCICKVESFGCKEDVKCGDGGASCGPYQIQYDYWNEGGRHGTDHLSCVKKFSCAEKTVRGYMNRYATRRSLGHSPNCEDYARIHNGGLEGYKTNPSGTVGYWQDIKNAGCTENS